MGRSTKVLILGGPARLTWTRVTKSPEIEWCRVDTTGTECNGDIIFHDTTPPPVSLSISPPVLWPPNHRMVPVQVTWAVNDACDPSPQVMLSSVVSSEPDDAPESSDGNTTGDIQDASIGTPDTSTR